MVYRKRFNFVVNKIFHTAMKKISFIACCICFGATCLPSWSASKSQLANAVQVTLHESYGTPRVTPVSDGMFGVQTFNKWSFYRIGGGEVFSELVLKAPHGDPLFDSGAVVMEDVQSRNSFFVILYSDGTKKELPTNWAVVTDFVDGVALVKAWDAKFKPSFFYINTKGEEIWPHLTCASGRSVDCTRKLRDNRRAFQQDGLWGYIDGDGRVVIEPQFVIARDFSENHAAVTVKRDGKYYVGFIAQNGDFSFPPQLPGFGYDNLKIGDLHSGRIRVVEDGGISYYDVTGNKLKSYPESKGTEFVEGWAMITLPSPDEKGDVALINNKFEVVSMLDDTKGVYNVDNYHPVFSGCGLAPKKFHREAMGPMGNSVISEREGNEDDMQTHYYPFSDDGYAFADLKIDGQYYYGIVDKAGNCVILFDRQAVPTKN